MNNNKSLPAEIHAVLAVGSVATTPYYDVTIEQTLCQSACVDENPVFSPSFSVNSISVVGTNQYLVSVHVEGVISYVPCWCGSCCTRSQLISQDFNVPVYSATEVTAAVIVAGSSSNYIRKYSCCNCSKSFVSDTPITINLTA